MRLYLADFFHVYHSGRNPDTNPCTVPLGIGFLAATVKHRMPGHDVRLFRDPDQLLKALRAQPPTVLGLSFCSWNSDISRRVAEIARTLSPDTVIVGGGPSVDDHDEQLLEFFRMVPALDYLVPNEGESGFVSLLDAIESGTEAAGPIPGVAYRTASGQLIRGRYDQPVVPGAPSDTKRISEQQAGAIPTLNLEVPSPYLDGTLDAFLDEGMVPIIQTMRGCPYQCHFCVSGATEWSRPRGFDLDRVKAEIEYALSRSRATDLILTDENWGLLGERDVEIARYLMARRKTHGSPNRLYYYTAKIVTQASRDIVELVAPIAWIGEFSMSFQSLNPQTRLAIKRTNISMDKLAANVQWARERKILTSSEMIYGFPYETPDSFFSGVERLLKEGVDKVQIYPLQLFPGIDLADAKTREDYNLQTQFRLSDGGYGVYDDGKLVSVESEEVVVGNRWSTLDDYFTVRRYGFFHMAILGRDYFVEFARLCSEAGVPMEPVLRHLTMADYSRFPALGRVMADHRREAESELKPSREDIHREVAGRLRAGKDMSGVKVNLVYLGRMLSAPDVTQELLTCIQDYFEGVLAAHPYQKVVLTYLKEVLPNRIVLLNSDSEDSISFWTRFDYSKWVNRRYQDLSDLLLPEPRLLVASMHPALKERLRGFNATNRSDLQGIFDKTPSKQLLRAVAS